MFFHPFLVLSIIVLGAVVLFNKHLKWWIKAAAFIYYIILFVIFDHELKNFKKQYKDNLSLKDYWDKNSDFVDGFIPFFAFPLLALIIYAHYLWFVNANNKNDKMAAAFTVLITGTFWFFFTFFISMHGYRP